MTKIKDAKFVYIYNKTTNSLVISDVEVILTSENKLKIRSEQFGFEEDGILGLGNVIQHGDMLITTDEDIAESLLNGIFNSVNGKINELCSEITNYRNYIGEMEELRNVIDGNRRVINNGN